MLRPYYLILAAVLLSIWNTAWAEQEVHCPSVTTAPVVDGRADDAPWSGALAVTTRDVVAAIDHQIRCVHTDRQIFMLVRFSDASENREHKTLEWKPAQKRYANGPDREDTLVIKWNMNPLPTDISLSAEDGYKADIWFWKSVRTDPVGFADDKFQIYTDQPMKKATRLLSKSDRRFYLLRKGDQGRSAYQVRTPAAFVGERIAAYENRTPEGSRADVRAKGRWSDGWWTVEFARNLATGHSDDVQISPKRRYQFGVSRYEIAGRYPDPRLQIPLYGSGEVGEDLFLVLDAD